MKNRLKFLTLKDFKIETTLHYYRAIDIIGQY